MAAHRPAVRVARWVGAAVAVAAFGLGAAAPALADSAPFDQLNLVSDIPGVARITDPNLVNPWGLSAGPTTPLWVADNGTNRATLYSGAINGSIPSIVPLVVHIPGGAPTGTVFNPTSDFAITIGGTRAPARFLFASEAGRITAWAPVSPLPTSAVTKYTSPDGAVYKGLTLAQTQHGTRLYAADFHNNRIDVFDSRFHRVAAPGAFTDPDEPAGWGPFNIQALAGKLYVTYAEQDAAAHDEIDGPGLGIVDVFGPGGRFLQRLVTAGGLNAPWGLVVAPSEWGHVGRDLLVGNFGDGTIHAYDRSTGALRSQLTNSDGKPIQIDGLWGLRFGNGTFGTPRSLTFAAGLADESHGLLGEIVPEH